MLLGRIQPCFTLLYLQFRTDLVNSRKDRYQSRTTLLVNHLDWTIHGYCACNRYSLPLHLPLDVAKDLCCRIWVENVHPSSGRFVPLLVSLNFALYWDTVLYYSVLSLTILLDMWYACKIIIRFGLRAQASLRVLRTTGWVQDGLHWADQSWNKVRSMI
jgi:hypothetical protein